MSDKILKEKNRLHNRFDKLWYGREQRTKRYKRLSELTGISEIYCHFKYFNDLKTLQEAEKAISIMEKELLGSDFRAEFYKNRRKQIKKVKLEKNITKKDSKRKVENADMKVVAKKLKQIALKNKIRNIGYQIIGTVIYTLWQIKKTLNKTK